MTTVIYLVLLGYIVYTLGSGLLRAAGWDDAKNRKQAMAFIVTRSLFK